MALSKLVANSFDLTDNYAFTGTITGVTSTQKLFLIKNLDASSSSTLSFVDGSDSVDLDNTYKTYLFRFVNIHPANDNVDFEFQGNAAGGSGFNETITSSMFIAEHKENDNTDFTYRGSNEQAQGTSFQDIAYNVGNDNDQGLSGELYLFNPSNTTFVKHFMANIATHAHQENIINHYTAGYFNTTSAIDEIQFKFSGGDIDSGRIALYGIK